MEKALELSVPTSCLNKAKDNELLFVLLERDKAAPAAIRMWIRERLRRGMNLTTDSQIVEARACLRRMEESQRGLILQTR